MSTPTPVSDLMSRDVITLREEDNLTRLDVIMKRGHVRHLPVVDGKRLVGLVTHRDLLRLSMSSLAGDAAARVRDSNLKENTFVASIMTRDVTTVRPETSAIDAARLLVTNRFGCLPVVDEAGDLVGIVTEHDFLRFLVNPSGR